MNGNSRVGLKLNHHSRKKINPAGIDIAWKNGLSGFCLLFRDRPYFFLNSEGVNVYGTNTHLEYFKPRVIDGEATVIFEIPSLHLINGTYTVDVAVHREDGFAYDYIKNALKFRVHSLSREVGIWRPPHEWKFEGGVKIEPPQQKKD